ncbi:MAG: DUF2244 domain-containing protein [Hydrogenophaga sp.]|nr:DUF2244 domain-containing protein [Hydrogenophaga sp.]
MSDRTSESFRLATVSDTGHSWVLRRNCAVTPGQLAVVLGSLGVLSLLVAGFFWLQGAVLILPFAVLELLALMTAFLVHARHAADGEHIRLAGGRLVVEVESAGQVHRSEFPADWVRVASRRGHALVEVMAAGRSVQVGRYIRPDLRPLLAQEIQRALRQA